MNVKLNGLAGPGRETTTRIKTCELRSVEPRCSLNPERGIVGCALDLAGLGQAGDGVRLSCAGSAAALCEH